ncbi:hypothetical protein [Ottowia sp. SB7-C50]|jgi:hypothetical protein|uniref:hypothetical protein n=1 Tax=Ottowia sp. SB7-C50 TaxID=3081231 RepID=UPI00295431CD|nr:hypothetical protein [Ottowia sp. SB7-C50]WOP14983.1 hypothetical protein R0D99_14320 [Ottowia sp. SB7-C50]
MSHSNAEALACGKFHLTPLSRSAQDGAFTAGLSIRRGRGMQTHDRVYTFVRRFTCRDSALRYAAAQARAWVANPLAFG